MELYFKEDWASAKEILSGWWNGKINNRWALGLVSPRRTPLLCDPVPAAPENYRERWLDYKNLNTRKESVFASHAFKGAVFPENTAYLGPGSLSIFLGADPDFQKETVWQNPAYHITPDKVDRLVFDRNGFYWNWTKAALSHIHERAQGRFIATMPDLIEGLDTLSELFGTNNLLMYMMDFPDDLLRLLDQLDDFYFDAYDELAEIIKMKDGSVPFMAFNVWAPGRCAKIQCDFSAMISPDMFDAFVLPRLKKQCARLDYTVYHLDGPSAIAHLDSVLSIPELNAIQWAPGAGNAPASDRTWWDKVWKKVYAAGKSAYMHDVPAEQIEAFVKEFGQAGTQIISWVPSEDDSDRMMDESLNW